jgi:3alpha(or 20beta)-hydroxysteroid dehydrogenase
MPLRGIADKVAVITGGAGGIGEAVGQRLVDDGAWVVLVDIDEAAAKAAAERISEKQAIGVAADVSTEEGTRRYIEAAIEKFGRIDLFHNNAGIEGKVMPIADADPAWFDKVIAVNLRGVYLGLHYVLRQMREQGHGGSIVNTASVAGLRGFAGLGPYVASKHAVMGLTKSAALEAAEFNVRVNAVCPGPISTGMMDRIERDIGGDQQEVHAQFESLNPLARYGTPSEVAALVAWLLSDESTFCTGSGYTVDGGTVAS